MNVCPKCDKHFRIDARTRLAQLLDNNEYDVFDADLVSTDPLKFVDLKAYSSRLKQAQADTGLNDAVINAQGKLNGRPVIVSAMEYSFIGGGMGGGGGGRGFPGGGKGAHGKKTPAIFLSTWRGREMVGGNHAVAI